MEAIVEIDYLIQIVKEIEVRVPLSVDARFSLLGRSVLVLKNYLNDVRNGSIEIKDIYDWKQIRQQKALAALRLKNFIDWNFFKRLSASESPKKDIWDLM